MPVPTVRQLALSQVEELLKPMSLPPLPEGPLVSVLMTNYNYARFIGEAIESVLTQTYQNFELVICDDGSTDNSCEVIEGYARRDPRVKLVRKPNGGAASALNAAYRKSRGEVICLLDADDVYFPEKVEKVIRVFRSDPRVGFVANKIMRIDNEGRSFGVSPLLSELPAGWLGPAVVRCGGVIISPPASGLSFRREVVERIFPLREEFRVSPEGSLQRLAPLMTYTGAVNEPLSGYRIHGGNMGYTLALTPATVGVMLPVMRRQYELQREYLANIDPRLAEMFLPFDNNWTVVQMKYVAARSKRDPDAGALWRDLVTHQDFQALPALHRWYWRMAPVLPRTLFGWAVNQLVGQSRLKQFLSSICRPRRRVAWQGAKE